MFKTIHNNNKLLPSYRKVNGAIHAGNNQKGGQKT